MGMISLENLEKWNIAILLVTAAKPEKEALLSVMRPKSGKGELDHAIGKNVTYNIGLFGKYLVAHVFCENQGSLKEKASILTIQEALQEIKPKAVIMIGIAFGANKEKQKIGDVLISKAVQSYDCVKVKTDPDGSIQIEDRNIKKEPGLAIKNQFINFHPETKNYNIWAGTLLSGEKLLDNKQYKKELLDAFSASWAMDLDIVGGEMEGFGLTSVLVGNDNPNWMIVKAISDWADGDKKEKKKERQKLAAHNAVDFCQRLFMTNLLTHINGIQMEKAQDNKNIMELVNPYAFYYYRSKQMLSFSKLAKQTKISKEELQRLEDIDFRKNRKIYPRTSLKNVQKLKEVLSCGAELNQNRTSDKMKKFYRLHHGKSELYPVENAKVVVFDFDGTLTKMDKNYSSWQRIWLYLGYSLNDCGLFHSQYVNGEISHQEWCDITSEHFIRKGLSGSDIKKISDEITLVDGAIETIKKMKEKGIKIYICSGSIDTIIENVLGDSIGLFEDYVCNRFTYEQNGKLKSIVGTKYDFDGKAEFLKKIIHENKISAEECIFIGNSDNDVLAYKSGAKTLVVNPRKITGMNKKEWKYCMIEMNNLNEILPYVFPLEEC